MAALPSVGDATVLQPPVQLFQRLHVRARNEQALAQAADLVLDLPLLPAGRRRTGRRLDQVMRAHLGEAPIELALLADEHGVHRRLHVVVDAALAGAARESKGPGMGVEHHLLALPRIRPDVGHAAVAKPGVRDLSFEGDAVEDDPIPPTNRLVGLGRREGQRNKGLAGLGLRLRRPNIRPAPSVTAHRVIAAGIAGPPKRLE